MSRTLVTYVDGLDSVVVAAVARDEREATSRAWNELLVLVGVPSALADHRQTVTVLPAGAEVRYVIVRTSGVPTPHPICSYGKLATARSTLRSLSALAEHHYGIRGEVQTSSSAAQR